jgi:hypothetical protein
MKRRKRKKRPNLIPVPDDAISSETRRALHAIAKQLAPTREVLEREKAEFKAREAEFARMAEAGKRINRYNAISDGLVPPPWIAKGPKRSDDGPQVRFAKKLMKACFPNGEWSEVLPAPSGQVRVRPSRPR